MRKRNFNYSKYNWRKDMDRAIAKKQRLEERLAETKAYFESEETRAALPESVRKRIEADIKFYGKKEDNAPLPGDDEEKKEEK